MGPLLINAEAMSKSKTKTNLHVTFLLPLLEVSQGICVRRLLYPLYHLEKTVIVMMML